MDGEEDQVQWFDSPVLTIPVSDLIKLLPFMIRAPIRHIGKESPNICLRGLHVIRSTYLQYRSLSFFMFTSSGSKREQ